MSTGRVVRQLGVLLAFLGGGVLFAALSMRELWEAGMLSFGDLVVFPSAPSAFGEGLRQAWSDRGLGGPSTTGTGVLLTAMLLVLTGRNATLAQQFFMTLWIPVAFCSMAYLCRRFIHTSWWLAAIGGLIYVASPVSIAQVVAGSGGLLWAYALLPLVIAGAEKLQREGRSAIPWFAAALALLATTSAELLPFGFLIVAVWIVVGHERARLALAGTLAIGLAGMAALPSLLGRSGTPLSSQLVEKVISDFEYTYARVTPQSLARLAGNQGDPMDALGYNDGAPWTYVGYLPIIALLIGLALRRKGDDFPIKTIVLASLTAGSLLAVALAAKAAPSVLGELSPVLAFRNPKKLMILLVAAIIPGSVYGVHRLFQVFPQRHGALAFGVVAPALLLYLGVYTAPALSGHWGIKTVRSSYRADDALLAEAQYLKRHDPSLEGRWRVVWLPFDLPDAANLEWILPQWANDPVLESRDPEVEDATALLEDALEEGDMRRFHFVADRASVRYLVLRRPVDPSVVQVFATDTRLELIRRDKGFEIWRNAAALPRIRGFSGLTAVVIPKRQSPVEYESRPLLALPPDFLPKTSGWTVYPGESFRRVGQAIRIRATQGRYWPVLARRIRADERTSYVISARVRTKNAAGAHLKVLWYRGPHDTWTTALRQDNADPVLSGDHGWTRLSRVVESPPGTRFAEVAFLAGKQPVGSRKVAVSWVKDIRIANRYSGDLPLTPTEAVADVLPITRSGHELIGADSISSALASEHRAGLSLHKIVVNPTFGERQSSAIRTLLGRGGHMEIAASAGVTLQPQRGAWRRSANSVEVASARGEAALPLGLVEAGHYVVSVTGCDLRFASVRIMLRTRTLRLRLSGPRRGCGRVRTTEPVALEGKPVVEFSLPRDASISSVHAFPVTSRRVHSNRGPLRISDADTPSPHVRGFSSSGLTLADAFHPGWQASGSSAAHFRTFLGFNGFVVRDPANLTGLSYRPQQTRDLVLAVGALGWVVIVVLLSLPALVRRFP